MNEEKKTRLIELLIKSVEATGQAEGVWFGLEENNEEAELDNLITEYKNYSTPNSKA